MQIIRDTTNSNCISFSNCLLCMSPDNMISVSFCPFNVAHTPRHRSRRHTSYLGVDHTISNPDFEKRDGGIGPYCRQRSVRCFRGQDHRRSGSRRLYSYTSAMSILRCHTRAGRNVEDAERRDHSRDVAGAARPIRWPIHLVRGVFLHERRRRHRLSGLL